MPNPHVPSSATTMQAGRDVVKGAVPLLLFAIPGYRKTGWFMRTLSARLGSRGIVDGLGVRSISKARISLIFMGALAPVEGEWMLDSQWTYGSLRVGMGVSAGDPPMSGCQ